MSTKSRTWASVFEFFEGVTHERVARFAPVAFYDDFIHGFTAFPAGGSPESGCAWCKKIQSTTGSVATPTVAGKANAANGTVELALGGSAELEGATLYMNDELKFNLTMGLIIDMVVNVSVLPTLTSQQVWGVASAYSASGPDATTYNAFFTTRGSGLVYCDTDDNVTDAEASSGITVVAGATHVYRIDCTNIADIKFYIDGASVATGTTFGSAASAANSKVQPYFACFKPAASAGAGVGKIEVDAVRCFQNRS